MPSPSDLKLENAVVRKLEGNTKTVAATMPVPKQNAYDLIQTLIDDIEGSETDEKKLALKDVRALQTLKDARTNLMIRFLFDEVCQLRKQINKK